MTSDAYFFEAYHYYLTFGLKFKHALPYCHQ